MRYTPGTDKVTAASVVDHPKFTDNNNTTQHNMIRVDKHPSFNKWYQVRAFGELLEEIDNKRQAVRLARKTAIKYGAGFFLIEDQPEET